MRPKKHVIIIEMTDYDGTPTKVLCSFIRRGIELAFVERKHDIRNILIKDARRVYSSTGAWHRLVNLLTPVGRKLIKEARK